MTVVEKNADLTLLQFSYIVPISIFYDEFL